MTYKISEGVRKAEILTIMADCFADKNRQAVQGLVCRHVSTGAKMEEHFLNMKEIRPLKVF